jgi:Uma2 family endonuclease
MSNATLEAPPAAAAPLSEYEIERGKPLPSFNHGMIQANLICQLSRSQEYRPGSEITLDMGAGQSLTPDLAIYPRQPIDMWHDEARSVRIPALVVEIVSMSQSSAEMRRKVQDYLNHGVKSCWLVDPPLQQVTVFTADGKKKTFEEGVITDPVTGLTADLEAIFA